MTERVFNVLFLCTHNSCRSVIAESIINAVGEGRFKGFSAGSHPSGKINAGALALLARKGYPNAGLRSKSWDEFALPDAPAIDFVFTVCDEAAGETCPLFPSKPITAHWGVADPSRVAGSDAVREKAFDDAHATLSQRISVFARLPLQSLDAETVQSRLKSIGGSKDADEGL